MYVYMYVYIYIYNIYIYIYIYISIKKRDHITLFITHYYGNHKHGGLRVKESEDEQYLCKVV